METQLILAINPGSTSTKIGIFKNQEMIFEQTLRHRAEDLKDFTTVFSQYDFRLKAIKSCLEEKGIALKGFTAVVGRGGLLKPIAGGTYAVSQKMLKDLQLGVSGDHASNLGGLLAYAFALESGVQSYIVDPTVVDELDDVARFSGSPLIQRRSIQHTLNQKMVAHRYAKDMGTTYQECNFIIAHLGGGISVSAHRKGRIIDSNNALDGDGPFSPERAGGLPVADVIKLAYSGNYGEEELRKLFVGRGGLVAYLGSNDGKEISDRIEAGDEKAKQVFEAMAYQIAKEIGAQAAVLKGKIDAVILTGGLAYSKLLTDYLQDRIGFLGKIILYPGEDELLALVLGVLRVLEGTEQVKEYV